MHNKIILKGNINMMLHQARMIINGKPDIKNIIEMINEVNNCEFCCFCNRFKLQYMEFGGYDVKTKKTTINIIIEYKADDSIKDIILEVNYCEFCNDESFEIQSTDSPKISKTEKKEKKELDWNMATKILFQLLQGKTVGICTRDTNNEITVYTIDLCEDDRVAKIEFTNSFAANEAIDNNPKNPSEVLEYIKTYIDDIYPSDDIGEKLNLLPSENFNGMKSGCDFDEEVNRFIYSNENNTVFACRDHNEIVKRKIVEINDFANICGYFYNANLTDSISVNNGYNCKHPGQDEVETINGKGVGKCYCWSCPLGFEPDEEDFMDEKTDNQGYEYEEGRFIVIEAKGEDNEK
jgi:hypothetical protein